MPPPLPPPGVMVLRTFTFGPDDVGAVRSGLPPGLRDSATSFEVLTSALWRARTAALELPPNEDVRLVFIANFRGVPGVGLPACYYNRTAKLNGLIKRNDHHLNASDALA